MFSQSELNQLQVVTSAARLSSYGKYLGTTNLAEAYGAYMWSTAVSTAFTPLIQTIEIALRNSINATLGSQNQHGPNWFETWVTAEANHLRSRNRLAGQSEGERLIAKAKAKVRQRDQAEAQRNGTGRLPVTYVPAWQSVLAELTFGFWVRFLTRWYWDVNHNTKLWPNHIAAVFPGAPTSMHAVGMLHKSFEQALDIRNRIHHQEPLWKHHTVANIDDAIAYLKGRLNLCLDNLDYIGRDQKLALQKFGVIAAIDEICTKDAFFRFTHRGQGQSLTLRAAKRGIRLIEKNTKDHHCVWVVSEGKRPQLVLRNANRRFF